MSFRPSDLQVLPEGPPTARLLWLPALGVPARKYLRFAGLLAKRGFAVGLHEWRGTGECAQRASAANDWGYREWLLDDVPASAEALRGPFPDAPLVIGGHSIGGQMALLSAALGLDARGLLVVASGVPHWRLFPQWRQRLAVGGFGAVLPPLTRALGHYPGQRLGFAGREAGQLMRDWAGTVRRGHYDGLRGLPEDLQARLARVHAPILGLRYARDWLVPPASLDALIAMTASTAVERATFDDSAAGVRADHFAWMREPAATATRIVDWWLRAAPPTKRRGLIAEG